MPEVTTPSDGRRFVRAAARAGTDFVKVYSHLAPEVYRAFIDEEHKVGLPVAGHIRLQVRALEAARAGQRSNEHLHQIREACTPIEDELIGERRRFYDGSYEPEQEDALLDAQVHRAAAAYDEATCERVARDLAESGKWQVPTLVNERRWFLGVPRERLHDSRLAYLPAAERAAWRRRHDAGDLTYEGDSLSLRRGWQTTKRVVEVLGRSEVGLLVGTDFGNPFVFPGASVHEEMELLVESGFTPLAALQAATSDAAAFMHATDDHGSVAPGKLADLVLLGANPLADITNTRRIAAVVLDGRYLDRAALDSLLTGAERTAHHDTVQEVPPAGRARRGVGGSGERGRSRGLRRPLRGRRRPLSPGRGARRRPRGRASDGAVVADRERASRGGADGRGGSSLETGRSAGDPSGSVRRSGRRGRRSVTADTGCRSIAGATTGRGGSGGRSGTIRLPLRGSRPTLEPATAVTATSLSPRTRSRRHLPRRWSDGSPTGGTRPVSGGEGSPSDRRTADGCRELAGDDGLPELFGMPRPRADRDDGAERVPLIASSSISSGASPSLRPYIH